MKKKNKWTAVGYRNRMNENGAQTAVLIEKEILLKKDQHISL